MTDDSSFITTELIKGFRDAMPASEHGKFTEYDKRAAHAGSDKTVEWKRAHKCARWAVEIASLPAHNKITFEIDKAREIVKEVDKSIGGEVTELVSLPLGLSISPKMDVELTWVFEAVHAAERVAVEARVGRGSVAEVDRGRSKHQVTPSNHTVGQVESLA